MMTKYRLILDCIVQSLVLIWWALLAFFYPDHLLLYSAIFIGVLSAWQVFHAWYEVNKHQDWYRRLYLLRLRRLVGYGLLTLGVGVAVVVLSFGLLTAFGWFLGEIVAIGLCAGGAVLALWYFFGSIQRLYQYYQRPRSFWDL